jgi:hypothetical protein
LFAFLQGSQAFSIIFKKISQFGILKEVRYIPGGPEFYTILFVNQIFEIFMNAPDEYLFHFPVTSLGLITLML